MPSTELIRKKLAFFFLLVFALSTTPKIYFHEALAHHKDGLVCKEQDKNSPCFHRQAFHCQFDELVVTFPYLPVAQDFQLHHPLSFHHFASFVSTALYNSSFLQTESRGPPRNA